MLNERAQARGLKSVYAPDLDRYQYRTRQVVEVEGFAGVFLRRPGSRCAAGTSFADILPEVKSSSLISGLHFVLL